MIKNLDLSIPPPAVYRYRVLVPALQGSVAVRPRDVAGVVSLAARLFRSPPSSFIRTKGIFNNKDLFINTAARRCQNQHGWSFIRKTDQF